MKISTMQAMRGVFAGAGRRAAWTAVSIAALVWYGGAGAHDHAHQAAHPDAESHQGHIMPVEQGRAQRSQHSYQIPDITLVDASGKQTSLLAELDSNQPVMLDFIFTSCTAVCPALSATFSQVQAQLGADRERIRMISISIDPEQDTPAQLAEYAKKYGADKQWKFLTGKPADILAAQQAFDLYRGNKMNHVPVFLFRSSADAPWIRYDGFASAADLVGEYRRIASR